MLSLSVALSSVNCAFLAAALTISASFLHCQLQACLAPIQSQSELRARSCATFESSEFTVYPSGN